MSAKSRLLLKTITMACCLLRPSPGHAQITPTDGDWALQSVVMEDTSQAGLMVRVGDIDNLGFGWPGGFDVFTGAISPGHSFPFAPGENDSAGTDRIMVGTSYPGPATSFTDGYTSGTSRADNQPRTIVMNYAVPPGFTFAGAVLQLFVDDFQPQYCGSVFQVWLNNRRAAFVESALNSLSQTGPVGRLLTLEVPPEFLNEIGVGTLTLKIDDPVTGQGDGFAIDFVKLLINPRVGGLAAGVVTGRVVSAGDGGVLSNVRVASGSLFTLTQADGTYTLSGVPAGQVPVRAVLQGRATQVRQVDVISESTKTGVDFALASGGTELSIFPAVELRFPTIPGGIYVLQSSENLAAWKDEGTLQGMGAIISTFQPMGPVRKFWRIEER